jgi:hypothetical protein
VHPANAEPLGFDVFRFDFHETVRRSSLDAALSRNRSCQIIGSATSAVRLR